MIDINSSQALVRRIWFSCQHEMTEASISIETLIVAVATALALFLKEVRVSQGDQAVLKLRDLVLELIEAYKV